MRHYVLSLQQWRKILMSKIDQKNIAVIAEESAEWLMAFEEKEQANSEGLRIKFVQWSKLSPVHIKEFLYISNIYNEIQDSDTIASIEEALKELKADNIIELSGFSDPKRYFIQPITQFNSSMKYVASIAAVCLLFVLVWFLTPTDMANNKQLYSTNIGEQSSVLLEDGTLVKLNTKTTIKLDYTAEFRLVELVEGEAIFNVAKDPNRPFRVNAGQTVAEALGTSFNVYRQNEKTKKRKNNYYSS